MKRARVDIVGFVALVFPRWILPIVLGILLVVSVVVALMFFGIVEGFLTLLLGGIGCTVVYMFCS